MIDRAVRLGEASGRAATAGGLCDGEKWEAAACEEDDDDASGDDDDDDSSDDGGDSSDDAGGCLAPGVHNASCDIA